MYPKVAPLALDLLEKLLQFDPSRRLTCEEALQHPYFTSGPTVGNPNPSGQYSMEERAQIVGLASARWVWRLRLMTFHAAAGSAVVQATAAWVPAKGLLDCAISVLPQCDSSRTRAEPEPMVCGACSASVQGPFHTFDAGTELQ